MRGKTYSRFLDRTPSKREVVVLLADGDKRTQITDIKTALRLPRNL